MSQFDPNMTVEQLVNDFRAVDPRYNNMSDELAYKVITRKFPQYKLESQQSEYNPNDESGIIDQLGTIWKDGYNRSLQGMSEAIATGKEQVYDLGDYHPGIIADIAAGVASFFTPLDFATTAAGGGLGGILAKTAGKQTLKKFVFKKLVNNNVSRKVAATTANKALDYAVKSGTGAGALGLY